MVFSRENHWHQWFFDGFAPLWPSPLTTFLITDHWTRWFFNGFGVIQPSPFNDFSPQTIAFNGFLWFWGHLTIVFIGFRWSWTIGPTMWWFRWIVHLYPNSLQKGRGIRAMPEKGRFSNINTVFLVWSRRTPIDVNGFIVYICICTFICYNLVIVYFHIKCNFCLCQLEQFNL